MAGNFVRTGLVLVATAYLFSVAFVFWNEGGFDAGPSPIVAVKTGDRVTLPSIVPIAPNVSELVIPSLGIQASMQSVGLTPNGAIGIPTNYTDVAWFSRSAVPGTAGTSVVVGHRDTRVFAPGVFRYLGTLVPGDDVYVDRDGTRFHFKLTDKRVYAEDTDRMAEIMGQGDATTRLNLITCDGVWNQSVRRYNERLVIFTELVAS